MNDETNWKPKETPVDIDKLTHDLCVCVLFSMWVVEVSAGQVSDSFHPSNQLLPTQTVGLIGTLKPVAHPMCVCVCVHPNGTAIQWSHFLSVSLCCAFYLLACHALFLLRLCLAEGLCLLMPVCVCVCILCLPISVHIHHPRISVVVLFREILPLSLSSSRSELVIKRDTALKAQLGKGLFNRDNSV